MLRTRLALDPAMGGQTLAWMTKLSKGSSLDALNTTAIPGRRIHAARNYYLAFTLELFSTAPKTSSRLALRVSPNSCYRMAVPRDVVPNKTNFFGTPIPYAPKYAQMVLIE